MGDVLNRGTRDRPRWYCRYLDENGQRRQKATHQPTKQEAEKFLASVEARIARGKVGLVEPTPEEIARRTITMRQLVARFLGEVEGCTGYAPPRIKDLKRYRDDARKNLLNRIPPSLLDRAAATVRLADVERLRDAILGRGLAGASAVQVLAAVSKLYNWSRKMGLVDCANPVAGVERPRCAASLDFLDRDEVARLLAYVEEGAVADGATWQARTLWPMVATAIYAGLRKGELFGLHWTDAALDAGRLDVLHSYRLAPKSGKPRHVPIHPDMARALRWWRDRRPDCEGLIFPVEARPGRWRIGSEEDDAGLAEALVAAGCHAPAYGHRWHMMRHTFASHFVMSGGSLLTLQRLLGHSTPTMTMRYAHLAPDFLTAEVSRMTFAPRAPAGVADIGEERRQRAVADGAGSR